MSASALGHARGKSALSSASAHPEDPLPIVEKSGEDEEEQHAQGSEQQQKAHFGQSTPKPYLKRRTKAVLVPKEEVKKPTGKARIDCWHRDKDTNVLIYGNRPSPGPARRSLLKRPSKLRNPRATATNPTQAWYGQQEPMGVAQPYKRATLNNPTYGQVTQLQAMQANRMMQGAPPILNLDVDESEAESMVPDENDTALAGHPQFDLNFAPGSEAGTGAKPVGIDELEKVFSTLHGPEYFLKDSSTEDDDFLDVVDPHERMNRQREMQGARNAMNSHDFRFSMIPFSHYNNSAEVNLYTPQSRIPYLYKDVVAEAPSLQMESPYEPSLFFKCYSDDIYEAILEDVRSHYLAISNQDLADSEGENEPLASDQINNQGSNLQTVNISSDFPLVYTQPLGIQHTEVNMQQPAVGQVQRLNYKY